LGYGLFDPNLYVAHDSISLILNLKSHYKKNGCLLLMLFSPYARWAQVARVRRVREEQPLYFI
jgi:hypothetical protein